MRDAAGRAVRRTASLAAPGYGGDPLLPTSETPYTFATEPLGGGATGRAESTFSPCLRLAHATLGASDGHQEASSDR
jgi:hypothetical protein